MTSRPAKKKKRAVKAGALQEVTIPYAVSRTGFSTVEELSEAYVAIMTSLNNAGYPSFDAFFAMYTTMMQDNIALHVKLTTVECKLIQLTQPF